MTSITAQQTKLDLKLVPKENRIDIGKCNGRIPRGLKPKEETFQHHDFYRFKIDKKKRFKLTLEVFRDIFQICPRIEDQDFDALPFEEDTVSFLRELSHTRVINSLNDVVIDQMHQPWRTFASLINRSLSGKTTALDKLRLSRAHILWSMYYQKNVDYMELLWEDFIYQIDNHGYKKEEKMMHNSNDNYLINTLRFVPRKEASQKYGAVLPECLTSPQMKESKAYKTYIGYDIGTVPPKVARKFKKASPSKKDSVPVPTNEEPIQKGKRVKRSAKKSLTTLTTALIEEDQMQEVRKKSLMDFHKSHPSSFGVLDVTKDESIKSESESWGNDDDDSNDEEGSKRENDSEEHELDSEQDTDGSESDSESDQQDDDDDDDEVKDDDDDEVKDDDEDYDNDDDKSEGDEDRGMDSDDVHDKKADFRMMDAQQEKENLKITQEQVVEDAHVTITKKTKVLVTSSSRSSDLASKFLKFSNIPPADAEIVSLLDVHVHHEVPRIHTSTLLAVPVSVIPEASPVYTNILQSSQTITFPPLQSTPLPLPTTETTNIPPLFLDFVSVFRFNDRVIALEKDVAELKNDPLHTQVTALVDDHLETRMGATREEFMNFLSALLTNRITKQSVHAEEPEFKVRDTNTPQGQEGNQGNDNDEPRTESASRHLITLAASNSTGKSLKEFNKLISTPIDFYSYILNGLKIKNLTQEILLGPAFRLLKGTHSNYAELEYDFKECYKALLEKLDWETPEGRGVSTMTYTTSTTKTKVAQYDLLGIKDMVPNIWSPVKVAYDKYMLWGISHWGDQHKTFYAYARGILSIGDVYSTKRILAVTHVSVMRKHRYGYLEEIMVRRADNKLYKFKEGDFPRLRNNDIKDMLLFVVQNQLINLSGDDVADFAIALRMLTKSLVIQKRVEDLQLGVESYQKQINVTKPDTTRPDLRKRHLLLSLLEDITKNIDIEYLLKRRWSTLEKKRAHCMIKDINKMLKERRMMRSLEKFVGGRLYGTDLRPLQRTI
nr:hypothetical protein [Tanacetum cinerariifolium]